MDLIWRNAKFLIQLWVNDFILQWWTNQCTFPNERITVKLEYLIIQLIFNNHMPTTTIILESQSEPLHHGDLNNDHLSTTASNLGPRVCSFYSISICFSETYFTSNQSNEWYVVKQKESLSDLIIVQLEKFLNFWFVHIYLYWNVRFSLFFLKSEKQ